MAMTIHIDVVSAESLIFSGLAEFVVAPAVMGEVGIYPNHAPLISRIKPGPVRIKLPDQDEETVIFVSGGILEVQPGVITVLSDTAIRALDIDRAKALEAKQRAEEAMKDKSSKVDYARAQAELIDALAQLHTLSKLKNKVH